jgi:hypothetical protein
MLQAAAKLRNGTISKMIKAGVGKIAGPFLGLKVGTTGMNRRAGTCPFA